jgi:heme o synthase
LNGPNTIQENRSVAAAMPAGAAAPRLGDLTEVVAVQRPLWRDYLELTKPEISFLVAISAVAGFMLGASQQVSWWVLLWTVIGVTSAAAGGCALNHYLERELDRHMKRTASRPIPAGRISARHAAWFGWFLVVTGVCILCPLVNPLTGILAAGTVALYLFVYTPLKRVSTLNTLVGTIPGALPALGGFTAATGTFGAAGWAIFAVLICWQIPHFYALAWMYRADYARGGHRMLSVTAPDGKALVGYVIVFSILMVAASIVPYTVGASGLLYLIGAVALGVWFAWPVAVFTRSLTNADARQLLKATVFYIPILVLLIVVDHLLGL